MKRHINYYFLFLSVLLIFLGVLFLANISAPTSFKFFGNTSYFLFHQLFSVAIGLMLAIVFYKIPIDLIKKIAPAILMINLIFLVLIFLPVIGVKFWGAKRWIGIGNNAFQPSEFLKITTILYVSAWLSNKFSVNAKRGWMVSVKSGYDDFIKVLLPFWFFLSIIALVLIFQPDISTLGIIAITLIYIYFAAGSPAWHSLLTIALGSLSAIILVKFKPYRFERFLIFLHPEKDPLGIGMQLKQSLIALGSGGIFGKGIGMSTQKFGFLPQAMSDSMFAIIGEETGIIGCLVLVLLFFFFFWFAMKIAKSSSDNFSKLTAMGITVWITLQAFINIASTMGIFPISGIPLPFFSYGGSHMVSEMIGIGLLLNISKNA